MASEITTTSGGTLTDASGNQWTLTSSGVVDENGTPVRGGSGTGAFAIVNNVYYGQDATTKAWFTYSPTSQTWTLSAAPFQLQLQLRRRPLRRRRLLPRFRLTKSQLPSVVTLVHSAVPFTRQVPTVPDQPPKTNTPRSSNGASAAASRRRNS
jgi:hypothetical protein